MTQQAVIFVVLIALLVLSAPTWGYSRNWTYYPSGFVLVILIVCLVLLFRGWL